MESYDIRLHAGGYWTEDGIYMGGNTHIIRVNSADLKMSDIQNMVISEGYSKNMDLFSYFPSGIEGTEKRCLVNDTDVAEMVSCLSGIKDIHVVRSDDPNFEGFRSLDDHYCSTDDSGKEDDTDSEKEEEGITFYSDHEELERLGITFHEGDVFQSKDSFKKAVDNYAIRGKLNISYQKFESKKVIAICVEEDCNWRIYASINSTSKGQFVVRSYESTHTCSWSGKVRLYTARKIANTFVNEFRIEPLKSRVIKGRSELDQINMSKYKCQRAREHCHQLLEDEHVEKFYRMWDYVLECRETNPGSTIILGTKAQVFEKFYACFYAQKCGWKKVCRRIIHVDGTHLKGRTKGQLLSAIGRDANDGMYPLAWAIVPVENGPNWEWFLELLRDDLEFGNGNGTTIVSDQQKGLIKAISLVCPDVEHRMCARHIWENLRKNNGESPLLRKTFWKLAKAYNIRQFNNILEDLKILRPDVHESINQYSSHWSRAFFQECTKSDVVDNNMSESFNNIVRFERYKHVMVLLEFVRLYVMRTATERQVEIQKYRGSLPLRIKTTLDLHKKKASKCQVCASGKGSYEVNHGRRKYIVNVRGNVSCSCRQYELSRIPCPHIIKALSEDDKTKKPEALVLPCFSISKWYECYGEVIQPMNGLDMWDRCKDVTVLPAPENISKGRRRGNKRKLESWEKAPKESKKPKFIVTCRKCGASGHNKRSCKNMVLPVPEPAPKRGTERPRNSTITSTES